MHSLSLTAQTINRTTDVNWLILPIAQRYVRSRFDRMRVKPRGEFRRQLEYKTAWRGGYFVAVDPKNTSRTCPCCGHLSKDNRKTQALFACVACGHSDHADTVGALNILAAGHAVIACGAFQPGVRPGVCGETWAR